MNVIIPDAINGIDVSSAQKNLDAQKIAQAGFRFAYIQSSRYSSTRDFAFASLLDKLRDAGLRVGAYHFCSHDSDPIAQAQFFYKASGGLGSSPGELPPMVDWEFCTPGNYAPPRYPEGHPAHCVQWLAQFNAEVNRLWFPNNEFYAVPRSCVVYSYPFYCGQHQPALEASGVLNDVPFCYASYGAPGYVPSCTSELPFHALPGGVQNWTLCQYSGDKGAPVPGVQGACDRQVFRGSEAEFKLFCGEKA